MVTVVKSMSFPAPHRGASLMLAFRPRLILVIGSNQLAASRVFAALEAGAMVAVLTKGGSKGSCEELAWRAERKEIEILDIDELAGPSQISEVKAIESFLDSRGPISLVCVTDTLLGPDGSTWRPRASATQIYRACRERNIPANVTDMPGLCDFTFCATHRFDDPETGVATPLQVAVSTNGQGCRLSGRLKREVVAKLPPNAGAAVKKVGILRALAKGVPEGDLDDAENEANEELTVPSPNRPVPQRSKEEEETEAARAKRRMKWVAQISEYWPISQLAKLSEKDMADVLAGELLPSPASAPHLPQPSLHDLDIRTNQGKVFLVGSGPGHPSLLTLAAHAALTREADLVLTDKLVPAGVLALIPKHVEVRVARKFPGNAEGAQQEMMDMALQAARDGKTVVRLKQGDPALYGRAGEELLFLRSHGIPTLIIPGISSALAAPLFADIPVTQRGAAESLVVCTGVGRQGRDVRLPGYIRARTLVLLMGVARLRAVIDALLEPDAAPQAQIDFERKERRRDGARYPPNLPVAIVERASMPDQRVLVSTLSDIVSALESSGEQRPPGMIVVGWAVLSLWGEGDMTVLDDHSGVDDEGYDNRRVERWLDSKRWRYSEGLDQLWGIFDSLGQLPS